MNQYVNSNVYKRCTNRLPTNDVRQILVNFDLVQNHTACIDHPSSGDVYLFFKEKGKLDYLADGWNWLHLSNYICKTEAPYVKISYYKSEFGSGSGHFKKRVMRLVDQKLPILVEYLGNDKCQKSKAHGK